MSEWSVRFEQSTVWASLTAIGSSIDKAEAGARDLEPAAIESLERLRTVLTVLGKRLAGADPLLVLSSQLDAVAAQAQAWADHVAHYAETYEDGSLTEANKAADNALYHAHLMTVPPTAPELEGLSKSATLYREYLARELEAAGKLGVAHRAELASLTTKLGEVGLDLAAVKDQAGKVVSEFQGQFSTAQDARSKAHDEAQNARQKRFDDFVAEAISAQTARSNEHTAAQKERQEKFDALLATYDKRLAEQQTEYGKDADGLLAAQRKSLDELTANYEAKAQEILAEAERNRQELVRTVGAIGTAGVTFGYQRTAEESRRRARVWQLGTVGSITILIAVAFFLLETSDHNFHWGDIATRVLLTLALSAFAAYSASQADKQLEAERRNRKLALELGAIGAYLAPLPEDAQHEFRIELGRRTFGQEDVPKASRSPATTIEGLREAKDLAVAVLKARAKGE